MVSELPEETPAAAPAMPIWWNGWNGWNDVIVLLLDNNYWLMKARSSVMKIALFFVYKTSIIMTNAVRVRRHNE